MLPTLLRCLRTFLILLVPCRSLSSPHCAGLTTLTLESPATSLYACLQSHPLCISLAFTPPALTPAWQLREEPRAPLPRARRSPGCTHLSSLKPWSQGWGWRLSRAGNPTAAGKSCFIQAATLGGSATGAGGHHEAKRLEPQMLTQQGVFSR